MLNLTKNSFHAKIYKWFYCTNTLPSNLCPYFWKFLIASVLCIFWFIIILPATIINIFKPKTMKDNANKFLSSILIYLVLFIESGFVVGIYGLFIGWFTKSSFAHVWGSLGIAINCVVVGFILIFTIINYLKNKISNRRKIYKPKQPNIVVEFIKATYGKYCPQISWID